MLVEHEGKYYESLSLAMGRVLLGKPEITPGYPEQTAFSSRDYSGIEWLELSTTRGKLRIPVDDNVATLIPYRGERGSFPYLSVGDALNGKLKPEQLKGKIVLLGTSAPGLMDLRSTPIITLSLASSNSCMETSRRLRRAASSAASFTRLARSAPENPGGPRAITRASTSVNRCCP